MASLTDLPVWSDADRQSLDDDIAHTRGDIERLMGAVAVSPDAHEQRLATLDRAYSELARLEQLRVGAGS